MASTTHSEKGNAFSLRSSRTFKSSDSFRVIVKFDMATSGYPGESKEQVGKDAQAGQYESIERRGNARNHSVTANVVLI